MAIITISRGSFSKGKEIAEKVSKKLGYECVSRDILIEASEYFNTPEVKLIRALHDAPSILDRFKSGKKRYIAYTEEAFLWRVHQDNVVYHGLAGHFFLKGVTHNLKVRIIADLNDRVKLEMERENISEEEARRIIQKDDKERQKWSMALYGIDTTDSSLYDMVLHIHKLTVDDAVDIISQAARLPHFQTTEESHKIIHDLLIASKVKIAVIDHWPDIKVKADDGLVTIYVEAPMEHEGKIDKKIVEAARMVDGVNKVRVVISPIMPSF